MLKLNKDGAPEGLSIAAGAAEVVIGTLVGVDRRGAPFVQWDGNPEGTAVAALATTSVGPNDLGRMGALLFAEGDPSRPLIVGFVRQPLDAILDATEESRGEDAAHPNPVIGPLAKVGKTSDEKMPEVVTRVDGRRLVLSADREIVLECGRSSITLTRAGKILIRGDHIVSRATGSNRIRGGSVQLN